MGWSATATHAFASPLQHTHSPHALKRKRRAGGRREPGTSGEGPSLSGSALVMGSVNPSFQAQTAFLMSHGTPKDLSGSPPKGPLCLSYRPLHSPTLPSSRP